VKIKSSDLEAVRDRLNEATASLDVAQRAARESEAERASQEGNARELRAAFDTVASAFAANGELDAKQLDALPTAVRVVLGYEKAEP
jgi:hypothetical protein